MISLIRRGIAYAFLVVTIAGAMYLYAMQQEHDDLFENNLVGDASDDDYNYAITHDMEVDTYLHNLEKPSIVESPLRSPKSPRGWVSATVPKKAEESASGSPGSVDLQEASPIVSPRPQRQTQWVSPRLQRNNQALEAARFATLKKGKKDRTPILPQRPVKPVDTLELSGGKILQLDSSYNKNLHQLNAQLLEALQQRDFAKASALFRAGANIHNASALLDNALAAKDLELIYFLQDHHAQVKMPTPELPRRLSMQNAGTKQTNASLASAVSLAIPKNEAYTNNKSPLPSPLPSPRPGKREAGKQSWVTSVIEEAEAQPTAFFSIGTSRQPVKKNGTMQSVGMDVKKQEISFEDHKKINTEQFHKLVRKGKGLNDFSELTRLLDSGVDIDSINKDEGVPPLVIAIGTQNLYLVHFLVENGANVNKQGERYDATLQIMLAQPTALQEASRLGQVKTVQYLLKAGANPNIADGRGTTPLMVAVFAVGNAAEMIARMLINAGADVLATNTQGNTALEFAGMFRGKEDYLDYIDRKQQEALAGQVPQSVVESYVESTIEGTPQNQGQHKTTEEEEQESRLIY